MLREPRTRIVAGLAASVLLFVGAVGWQLPGVVVAVAVLAVAGAVELALLAPPRAARSAAPPPRPPAAEEVIRQEVERSRRHQRPCAVVRIPSDHAAHLVSPLRRNDSVLPEPRHLFVLLPETDHEGALTALERVAPDAAAALGREDGPTVACFPADALTVHGLLLVLTTPPPSRSRHRQPRGERSPLSVEPGWPA